MPKIRDLGVNTIPFDPQTKIDGSGGYWMCAHLTGAPPPEPCSPTPRKPPPPPPPPKPGKKYTGGLPHDAVIQLRQQLHQHIGSQLHG